MVYPLEAVFPLTLVEVVLEHQMNVKITTKCCLVLQKKSKNQLLIQDKQEVGLSTSKLIPMYLCNLTIPFYFRQNNQEL